MDKELRGFILKILFCNPETKHSLTFRQRSVVIMSLEDYRALEETAYLLRSPKNARRILCLEGGVESLTRG